MFSAAEDKQLNGVCLSCCWLLTRSGWRKVEDALRNIPNTRRSGDRWVTFLSLNTRIRSHAVCLIRWGGYPSVVLQTQATAS